MSLTDQLGNTNNRVVEDVIKIAKVLFPNIQESIVKNIVWLHWFYGTLDVIYRKEKIIAVVCWDITMGGKMCEVRNLFIADGEKGILIMKHFIARNWHRFPYVQYIRFFRNLKYPQREAKIYPIAKILHLEKGV